jgi:hypothetical protein
MCRAKKSREAYEALGAATEEIQSEQTERRAGKPEEQTLPGESGREAGTPRLRNFIAR